MKEYTIKEYDKEDYEIQKDIIENMSHQELAEYIRGIARGWIPDYNFTGDESDFDNYKYHMIMNRVAKILDKM